MKLVTYDAGAGPRVGLLRGETIRDAGFDGDMVALIEAAAPVQEGEEVMPRPRLLAPLRPRSLRDFLAFEGHLQGAYRGLGREIPSEWYEVPAYYKGMPDTVIGPDDEVPWPSYTDQLDHELELAAVIGRRVRDVRAEDAAGCIFGYTIWNDLSARDVQRREAPIGLGPGKAKDWDGSNVLGPCLVTADEFDASAARMTVRVNGAVWGESSTAAMHHSFADMIAYASQAQTLHPGEVIGSGTAAGGSGLELDRWLQPGDLVELEVEGVGVLRNTIGAKEM
ncbi:MAG: fumarylacetoacetate hydrolase family protein [Solirubrobacterales bacterium]|nr:fumarylacetoacetate hydrolase family protein [Solirubrobacterales bacterium]MBV9809296.1 fumarylacetoacetate hydrolase family protein [Solirubrobacterales bacterium]